MGEAKAAAAKRDGLDLTARLDVRIPPELEDAIERYCRAHHQRRADALRQVLLAYFLPPDGGNVSSVPAHGLPAGQ